MPAIERATPARRMDRLARWTLQSSLHSMLVGAIGYVVWQPVLFPLMHLASGAPLGFASAAMWTRFELTEFGLGSLVGSIFFYSRHWRPRSWHRDWAEWAIPGFALAAASTARELPTMNATAWVVLVLVIGALTGAFFASITQGVRRLTGTRSVDPHHAVTDVPLD